MSAAVLPCPSCAGFLIEAPDGMCTCEQCGKSGDGLTLYGDLSERRKADREQMLQLMVRLCERIGVPYEIEREVALRPRAVGIRGPTGLCATIDFDGKSCQPDIHVVSWHMRTDRNSYTIIRSAFCHCRNEYHKRKATSVFYFFPALVQGMAPMLQMIAAGTATEEALEGETPRTYFGVLP
jgi:hypothetical protein